jgi:hypothetical protein
MVTAKALKLWRLGHLQWHALPTEFHKIYQLVQKLMGGGTTDRVVILLAYFFL